MLLGFVFVFIVGVHARRRGARNEKAMEALRIQNLKKAFGGLPAIADVSLSVQAGERRLIIGPNGAGKTTLFNLLTGDLPRDAGSIELFGAEVARLATHRRVHLGLARTYQIITLFPNDTLGATTSPCLFSGFRALAGTLSGVCPKASIARRTSSSPASGWGA